MKKTIILSGNLKYADIEDHDNATEYEIHSLTDIINLSNILEQIFNSENKYIEIKIMNCCKLIYEEKGNLMKYKSYDSNIIDYHINGNCLGDVLFNNTDSNLEITIFAPSLPLREGIGDCNYDTKQIAK